MQSPPASSTPQPTAATQAMRDEVLRNAYAALPLSIIATFINSVILSFVMTTAVSASITGIWLGGLTSILVLRAHDYYRFIKNTQSGSGRLSEKRFDILALATAACWGVAGVIFFSSTSAMQFGFLVFTLAGIAAGAVASLAVRLRTAQWYVIICLAPLTVELLLQHDRMYLAMSGMVLLFLAFCLSNASRTSKNISENIRLRLQSAENETMIRQQEALLHETGRIGKIGGWYYDAHADVFRCTQQIYTICGITDETKLTIESALAFIPASYRTKLAERFDKAIKAGESFDTDAELDTASGKRIWVRIAGTAIDSPPTAKHHLIGIVQDISDRKAVELAKSAFLANMSHEIRTPIHGIIGMLQLLDKTTFTDQQCQHLSIASESANHLLSIINDILDYSKLDSNKVKIQRCKFDLPNVILQTQNLLAPLANRKGLSLQAISTGAPLPTVLLGDPERMQQILTNLTANAIKFTAAGTVTIKHALRSQTSVTATIRFEVIDTGIGIDPATQARLFVPFEQADASTTRQYGGTGLGLSICKQLVELMHGSIGIVSAPGQGTTFWFEIPFALAGSTGAESHATEPAATEAALSSMDFTGKRILLVEDNEINQMVAVGMLRKYGSFVEVAAHGQLAVEILQSRQFDLVLMDIQMPVMDGLEATRLIRRHQHTAGQPPTPIIALTANAFEDDRKRYLQAGMDDYLSKPFSETQLLALLNCWLDATQPVQHVQPPAAIPAGK